MKSIAYLVSDYSAPSHTFVRREVEALRSRNVEIRVFSVQPCSRPDVECLLGRSAVSYAAAFLAGVLSAPLRVLSSWRLALRHRPPGLRALVWSQFHFLEAILLARMLKSRGIGHLHVHFANSGATVGLIAAHHAAISFSMTLHGISETDYPAGYLLARKVEAARFVACASHFMRAQALRLVAPDHWAKCSIVRCGVDLENLPRPSPSLGEGTRPRLVCVGRLSPEKGHAGLFEALARLSAGGQAFALTLVGDGPAGAALRARAQALGLADRIEFAGALSEGDTLQAIAEADALVLASLMEGLPVVLIEAMALAKPVVAPRVAGIPELVEDGGNGLLFTPSDWTDLERALRRLLAERQAWTAWGEEGRRRVAAEFSIHDSAARMATLFEHGTAP